VVKETTSSLERLLRVIDLFTPERPEWSADEIGEVMGVSRATRYRYVRTLTSAGLLASSGYGLYRLGPRFIVLDRQIRLSDPLLQHGKSVMAAFCRKMGHAQLLCTYFGDQVLCVHQESTNPEIHSSMERGRPFPLFRGSPSRSILAWLPETHLRRIMLTHPHEIRETGLGSNWNEFRQKLREIRAEGHYIGRGEIDRDLMGIGVPIHGGDNELAGSLTTIMPIAMLQDRRLARYIEATKGAAEEIGARLLAVKG
jgi:DNA-binding IclR family transcriptional regulator